MVRHCGRLPRRLRPGAAAHPPARSPARRDLAAPSPGPPRSALRFSELPRLPPSPLPARAPPLRERRGGGAEPGLVGSPGDFGARARPPDPSRPGAVGEALGRGREREGGNGPVRPGPLARLHCVWPGPGSRFRVRVLLPTPPGREKERLCGRCSARCAPGACTPRDARVAVLGAGSQPFTVLHHLPCVPCFWDRRVFSGHLAEVGFTAAKNKGDRGAGGRGAEVQPVLISSN